jgi:hypothetical protein
MKKRLAASLVAIPVLAQAPLTPPPPILQINREFVKPGKLADVLKIEHDSVAAQARLKSPHSYLTIASMSGPDDLWWLHAGDSYGFFEKEQAKVAAVPGLLDAWARIPVLKADLVSDTRTVFARFRDDLSYGRGLSGAGARYFLVTTVSVRPGHGAEFAELRKIISAGHERERAADNISVYEVESGMPDGTFLIFSSAANLDDAGALSQFRGRGVEDAIDDSARTQLRELSGSAILKSETILFAVNPDISFPAKEWIQSDPDFWSVNAVSKEQK